MKTDTLPPVTLMKLADAHIKMYSGRLKARETSERARMTVNEVETRAYLTLWEDVKRRADAAIRKEEQTVDLSPAMRNEVRDAIDSGGFRAIIEG